MKNHISFRLRKELDADLIHLNVGEDELPDLCRNGLRLMLGIRTSKRLEIQEIPLRIPQAQASEQKEKTAQPQTRPAGPYVPKQRTN